MQKLYSQIIGMPVFDEYALAPLALVQDVLIDPENGHVVGFRISRGRIIVPLDVSRITTGIFIQDRENIMDIGDVLRVKEIFHQNIPIIGARVRNTKKQLLGKVVDFEFDTQSMSLSHIFTAKTFFFFHFDERVFAHKQIISITKEGITVKDIASVPVKEKVAATSSAFA